MYSYRLDGIKNANFRRLRFTNIKTVSEVVPNLGNVKRVEPRMTINHCE